MDAFRANTYKNLTSLALSATTPLVYLIFMLHLEKMFQSWLRSGNSSRASVALFPPWPQASIS